MKAWSWTGYIFTLAIAVGSIVFLIIGMNEISRVLGICMCIEIFVYFVSYFIINKKY